MEDWLTYLLIATIIINVYVVAQKYFFKKTNTVREGFINTDSSADDSEGKQQISMKDRPNAIVANTEPLYLGQMKDNCKKIYDKLHENISYNMHALVKDHGVEISKDPMKQDAQDKMKAFNVMRDFQEALEESRQHLTKNAK